MQTLVNRLTAIIDDYTKRFNRFTAAELVQVHLPCAAAYACRSVWQNLCNGQTQHTVAFVAEDYVRYLLHRLKQITG
jgi:hypothetical protein